MKKKQIKHTDFLLIGGGIMSATLAILLFEKFPGKRITVIEKLPKMAEESSEAWNNAGTGHSGNCELNYTPEIKGGIDTSKAAFIASEFQESLNFWEACSTKGYLKKITNCLHKVPHLSFVEGKSNVAFLEKRQQALIKLPHFKNMKFSTSKQEIAAWIPLMMQNRSDKEIFGATYFEDGYDVNFGEITDQLFEFLSKQKNVHLINNNEVHDLEQVKSKRWLVDIDNKIDGNAWFMLANYVFIGAGGGALPLLEKANVAEAKGYAGFPISGLWLRCINPEIIEQHHAKVYGIAKEGSPPMSVPHMDTRIINGRKELLFGPFAGFTTKFLKHGSIFDLPKSVEFNNVLNLLGAGYKNLPLVKYLLSQVTQSFEDRMNMLREFYPNANSNDWKIVIAGQRVQIIKGDKNGFGKLEFGTEVIVSQDKSITALIGASPGASTSYAIMKDLLDRSFN